MRIYLLGLWLVEAEAAVTPGDGERLERSALLNPDERQNATFAVAAKLKIGRLNEAL
jgi:hypothetical protein